MLTEPKEVRLKDGRAALLRNPDPDADALTLIACLKAMTGETEFLLRYPEECAWTEAQEREVLSGINGDAGRLMLVCEIDGHIAGMGGLNLYGQLKFRHRASIDIALKRQYWGLGIGTAMIRELLQIARERSIRQVELEYIEGNDRGQALYEKLGFVQVAEHPDAVRLRDGSFRKLVFMMKVL